MPATPRARTATEIGSAAEPLDRARRLAPDRGDEGRRRQARPRARVAVGQEPPRRRGDQLDPRRERREQADRREPEAEVPVVDRAGRPTRRRSP